MHRVRAAVGGADLLRLGGRGSAVLAQGAAVRRQRGSDRCVTPDPVRPQVARDVDLGGVEGGREGRHDPARVAARHHQGGAQRAERLPERARRGEHERDPVRRPEATGEEPVVDDEQRDGGLGARDGGRERRVVVDAEVAAEPGDRDAAAGHPGRGAHRSLIGPSPRAHASAGSTTTSPNGFTRTSTQTPPRTYGSSRAIASASSSVPARMRTIDLETSV